MFSKIIKSKGMLLCIFALLLVLSCIIAIDETYAAKVEYGNVSTDGVHLRAEPSTDCSIVADLPLYTRVEILSYEDNWYHVIFDGDKIGYVRSDMIFVNSSGTRTAYVVSDNVNLRGAPSTSAYIVTTLTAGQSIKVSGLVGEWYFATAGDETGYVYADFLSISRPGSTSLERLLKVGMRGLEVEKLQNELYKRGFISSTDITGYFGSTTRDAVAEFQEASGLYGDGIAGDATITAVYDKNNTVTHKTALYNQVKGTVELLDWFEGGSDWLARGAYFKVTDVKTGLSFNVRRFGGWYHADSEPVTAEDTRIMKEISGGSWSWNRRAIWVTYNGRTVAASMHTMPHMVNPTASNNFDGHFCIHLLHSKVHATSRACPRHQACVMEAYYAGKG